MPESTIPAEALRETLTDLRVFVVSEFASQRALFQRQWALPEDKRVSEGHCLRGLRFVRRTANGHWQFRYDENETDFRDGDFLRLHTGDPLKPLTECALVIDEPPHITIDTFDALTELRSSNTLCLDTSYFDLESIVLQGIDELGATIRGRQRILTLLHGDEVGDAIDQDIHDEAWTNSTESGYNDSQCDAIAAGSASQWCSLIQGPPGSGKTRVLANIVADRLARGQRILITACTHRAIHQALRMLKQLLPGEERIAKIGGIVPDPDLPVDQYEYFSDSPLAEMEGGYVVGATVFATRTSRLKGVEFDALLIDEASQMTVPLAILGMLTSDTYIIIGDSQQLPPVVQTCNPMRAHEHSIFSALKRQDDVVLLDTTYRMNAEITHWASEQFYHGELQAAPGAAARRLQVACLEDADWLKQALAPEAPLIWIEHDQRTTRHVCMEEVDLVHQLTAALLRGGLPPSELAIISPFRKQGRRIRKRLQEATDLAAGLEREIVVDTVERMQGQEREVILISCAASEPSFVRAVADFLFLPSRLNVAVTRARSKVILISSAQLLKMDLPEPAVREALGVWRDLRASSQVIHV